MKGLHAYIGMGMHRFAPVGALGQRIRKTLTSNGQIVSDTLYHYDLAGHLIGESDGTGKVSREILWLDDTPLAVLQ